MTTRTKSIPAGEAVHEEDLHLQGLIHDLNNIWQTIAEAADLIGTDPRHQKFADMIARNVDRGRRLVASYKANSRTSVELGPVLESAMDFARDYFRVCGISVQFRKRIEPGLRVPGLFAGWERVFFNIFINAGQAAKAVSAGAAFENLGYQPGDIQGSRVKAPPRTKVEISAHRIEGKIELSISDCGPGIPLSLLSQIFDAHFTTGQAHSGLGLQIVRSIIQQQGGTIRAENREGSKGAVFRIIVPAAN